MKYSSVFVAGTFDRLHDGHKKVLQKAFENGEKVTVGVTSDAFVSTYKLSKIGQQTTLLPFSYHERKNTVEEFIKTLQTKTEYEMIQIDDPYEPAASLPHIDAIIVTEQNKQIGQEINKKRTMRGLAELELIEVPIVPSEDHLPLSSTRIRNGEVDTKGKLMLPDHVREVLQKPFGRVLRGAEIAEEMIRAASGGIITVGDKTTLTARELDILPSLSVIDFQVERQKFEPIETFRFPKEVQFSAIKSGPGFLSGEVVQFIQCWVQDSNKNVHVLIIDGEDDLVTLPLLVYCKPGAVLFYGQPGEGVVQVVITEKLQKLALSLLEQFELINSLP